MSEITQPQNCSFRFVPDMLMVRRPGKAPISPAPNSYFKEPILGPENAPRGRSRRWGDASADVQRLAIESLCLESRKAGLNALETAFVLAAARLESGFNPDAAAGASSASGLGQFIDATGRAYGLNSKNRFNLQDQARALVEHTKDNIRYLGRYIDVSSVKERFAYLYALHHDGPSLNHGGLEIAEKKLLPWVERFYTWLSSSK